MLNARDVAALNRARGVLKRLEDVALNRALGEHDPFAPVAGWDLGRLSEAAWPTSTSSTRTASCS